MSNANKLIEKMPDAFVPELAHGLKMTVQFIIEQPMYTVIDNGICEVHHGHARAPDVTLTMSDEDLIGLMSGELNGVGAFMSGRLKVDGNFISARKLPSVFDRKRLR